MKKLLPENKFRVQSSEFRKRDKITTNYQLRTHNSFGFTLVELMVVIAIIGILAVVALGIFSGAQGSARDARRVAEIDSLAKNIESTRDPLTGTYRYTGGPLGGTSIMARDYPTGLADPGNRRYCYAVSATTTPPTNPTSTNWSTSCPRVSGVQWTIIGAAGGSPPSSNVSTRNVTPPDDLTDPGVLGWNVCAVMERSNTVYCKSNTIR